MKVKEVMKEVVAIDKDISIKEAAKIMNEKEIGSLVVVNKDAAIVGIITKKDIMKNVSSSDRKISGVMNKEVFTINQNENISEAAALMAKNKVKHLPVIAGENEKLAGIITATDIIQHSDELDEDFFF
jgi:CBS domain-containing protein